MWYLRVEGYPTEADLDSKESNINHLDAVINPILNNFILITECGLPLMVVG